jgi:general secretion pathway protein F
VPSYRWSAIADGEVVRGVMDGADRGAVVDRLQRQGHIVLRAELTEKRGALSDLLAIDLGRRRELSKPALAEFTRELAIMLGAGQDLDRALRFVAEQGGTARSRALLAAIRDRVRGGSTLSAALATRPASFPRFYIGLVRAGEAGGNLGPTLDRIAGMLERQQALNATLVSALIYPAILVFAAIASIVFLLEFVLPQFTPLFEEAGAQLPGPTRVLLATGDVVGTAGPWLLLGALVIGLIGYRLVRRPAVRLAVDRVLLRVPVLGRLLREIIAARLTRTLGTLLQNGVPLLSALTIAAEGLGNRAAAAAVEAAATEVKGGTGLARPLTACGIFPERTTHLIQLGEEAAQLAAMALRAADIHDARVRQLTERMVALIVPTVTIGMGLAVAAIIGSLVSAMLSLNDLAV